MTLFSDRDLEQIRSRGMNEEQVRKQISSFVSGFPPAELTAPAVTGNGIIPTSESENSAWEGLFDEKGKKLSKVRFIPASGAATRMFKALFTALEKLGGMNTAYQWGALEKMPEVLDFIKNIMVYPFAHQMQLSGNETPSEILEKVLGEKGLNYGNLPKGMLLFHSCDNRSRTALEEHLREAAAYCTDVKGELHLHLTVSPDHLEGFRNLSEELLPEILKETGSTAKITFSTQKAQTDTIAVDMDNLPVRDENGALLFRPGGHGALLENLNDLKGDIIFISNIDNVAPDRNKALRIRYKKILGGILLEIREKLYHFQELLVSDPGPDAAQLQEMKAFLQKWFFRSLPGELSEDELKSVLTNFMFRPLRICGMVRNVGEPGGGPFFVRDGSGEVSLQIVESSQIRLDDPAQAAIFKSATHFNPVDIACCFRDFRGNYYDLTAFTDPQTGFISSKSVSGKEIKALELPGLWNGSMAKWLTVFTEVPIETFTPVKTVFDLLRPEHSR
ncbi:MAG: DUF4301 family protein [Bacteroidota bacterium]